MRILFLTHYFPPEGAAAAARAFAHSKRWVARGDSVTVITCVPNYPAGVVHSGYQNCIRQVEFIDGIRVVRIGTYIAANMGVWRRAANYLSYMIGAILASLLEERPDVILATSGQFFCGLAGVFVSRLLKCPFLLEIRDLWPDSIAAVGAMQPGLTLRLVGRVELFMYRSANHIVTVGDGYQASLIDRGVAPERLSVVMNGVDRELFYPRDKDIEIASRLKVRDRFVVSYCGAIGMAHGLDVALQSALLIRKRGNYNVVFLMVGDGALLEPLRKEASRLELDNVVFAGAMDRTEIPAIISASDACLVHLRRSRTFTTVMPSKIFEAAAMAKPVILGVRGFAEEFVRRAGCGLCVEPENAKELADAVLKLAGAPELCDELGTAGYDYVNLKYDRDKLAERYRQIICRVVRSTGGHVRVDS